jgi:hypothetical protein
VESNASSALRLLYRASNGVEPCGALSRASTFDGRLVVGNLARSASGFCSVQPGPGYTRNELRPASSIGVMLEAVRYKVVGTLMFSTTQIRCLMFFAIGGGATS